ncbi:putative membrane protein YesL [Lederbergia galactosidilyticus]|uniref:YesL family protein n=1 Tax=Lederbergia galactosidilytica TaxID=217031 RepID=UPI001AE54438|nr:DUF624 domain-containing protein [Lederbergia galactosidilytica]MBP1915774.1 putative membrane protein YesL [Lederbergia galactosidilytica]
MNLQTGLTGGLYKVCEWMYRLAYLNLLWIIFTFIGFIIVGFGPATVAMYSVMRKWLDSEDDFSVFPTFLAYYRLEFKQANKIGLVLFTVSLFIVIDTRLVGSFDGVILYIFLSSLITVSILLLVVMLYIFPLVVQYKNTTFQYFKSALILGVSFPIRTLLMFGSVLSVVFICLIFPVISFFYLGSGLSFITMFFSDHLFRKINEGQMVVTN